MEENAVESGLGEELSPEEDYLAEIVKFAEGYIQRGGEKIAADLLYEINESHLDLWDEVKKMEEWDPMPGLIIKLIRSRVEKFYGHITEFEIPLLMIYMEDHVLGGRESIYASELIEGIISKICHVAKQNLNYSLKYSDPF